MTDDSSSVELFSTPELTMDGEGDGIKNVTGRKRTPVPSSRKFNARTPCDDKIKLKLEKALNEMHQEKVKPKVHNSLTKSLSVAEITPTKSKPKKKPILKLEKLNFSDSTTELETSLLSVTLHATPRPLDVPTSTSTPKASRRCTRKWAECKVYGRLMLCVWRRTRARYQTLSESCDRQKNQIIQLEVQVDFLKNMRNSECEKRDEALADAQRMKKKVEVLEMANNSLIEELKNLHEELKTNKKNLKYVKYDLKKCSEQLARSQDLLKKRKEEKIDLMTKLENQEQEIFNKNSKIIDLQQMLKTSEKNLHNLRSKQEEFDDICQELETQVQLNLNLKNEMSSLEAAKAQFEMKSQCLEEELETYISNMEELQEVNTSIRYDMEVVTKELIEEKKRAWNKNTKELALLSLAALQKIVKVVFITCIEIYKL